jgi:hypothetical protein
MNMPHLYFDEALRAAALGQAAIACLNLFLIRLLQWEQDIAAMPLLLREVFQVHKWFISITLWIFAGLTLAFTERFAGGGDALARSLAAGIALFWGFRTWVQVGYYSASHWKGIPTRTAVHVILFFAYGFCALAYGIAAAGGAALLGGAL